MPGLKLNHVSKRGPWYITCWPSSHCATCLKMTDHDPHVPQIIHAVLERALRLVVETFVLWICICQIDLEAPPSLLLRYDVSQHVSRGAILSIANVKSNWAYFWFLSFGVLLSYYRLIICSCEITSRVVNHSFPSPPEVGLKLGGRLPDNADMKWIERHIQLLFLVCVCVFVVLFFAPEVPSATDQVWGCVSSVHKFLL